MQNSTDNCPPNYKTVRFDHTVRQIILHAHNYHRNFIAGGNETKLCPACRMATLSWEKTLAQKAAFEISQYKMGKDLCNNTDAFSNSKQNLATWGFLTTAYETKDLITAIQSFYNEVENVNQTYIDSYPVNYTGP